MYKIPPKSQNKQDIVKSNALVEAYYRPGSIWRMRVLLACLMQVEARHELTPTQNFVVTADTLAALTGAQPGDNYGKLKKAAEDLRGMYVTVHEGRHYTEVNVTSSVRYYPQQSKISVRFNAEIIPYIPSLSGRFTRYQAQYVMPMRSSYGIRLYELCLQWLGDEREFSLEEFKRMFQLENKYTSIKDLKKYVINPAIADINTHSDIQVEFHQHKTGRRVTHFQFCIIRQPKPKLKSKSKPKLNTLSLDE